MYYIDAEGEELFTFPPGVDFKNGSQMPFGWQLLL